jgi:multifunctional 2-oxoglutarate metabolism enzyme
VAIVRIEQLHPFPKDQILEQVGRHSNAKTVRWVQEEPENMGAYHFIHGPLHSTLPDGISFTHAARDESGAPATGSATVHDAEQEDLIEAAFEGL